MSVLACDLDLRPMTSCTPPSHGHVAVIDRGRVAIIYLLTTDPKVAEFFFRKQRSMDGANGFPFIPLIQRH